MRWRLTHAEGSLAGAPLEDLLDNGGVLGQGATEVPAFDTHDQEQVWLERQCRALTPNDRATWWVLPDSERHERHHWQDLAASEVQVAFGRSGVTLALSQINRLQEPATLVAMDRVPGSQPKTVVESRLRIDLEPDSGGLGLKLNLVDGRLDGSTDLTTLLEKARDSVPSPEVLFMPGTGGDASLDHLVPCLSAMDTWVGEAVRWEFAEARIGPLGVAGSLFNWFWAHEGYRLGDWQGPVAILDMDAGPLVGLSVVDYNA